MADVFMKLEPRDREEILRGLATQIGLSASVLEKDVWICWVLQHLFTMPDALKMTFKGGTPLSKVFGVIHRFSEDLDVTIDHRALHTEDPFAEGISKSRVKSLSDELKARVKAHSTGAVVPHLIKMADEQFGAGKVRVEEDETGEKVRVYYETVLEASSPYLGSSVLVEFGGRNITEPSETREVRPYIAAELAEVVLPIAHPSVLSPQRTFWEKATLAHVECHRIEVKHDPDRISRHWYDLTMLANDAIGKDAIKDRELLKSVVTYKSVFYNSKHANYGACLSGGFRLVPTGELLERLRADYERMKEAGMFYKEPPTFDEIIARLAAVEAEIKGA